MYQHERQDRNGPTNLVFTASHSKYCERTGRTGKIDYSVRLAFQQGSALQKLFYL